jgi:hypothetical protein
LHDRTLGSLTVVALLGLPAMAQLPTCTAPAWSSCDLSFDLDAGADPTNVELRGEFRSPRARTVALTAFRDSDRRWVIRFTPTEAGSWEYRLTSNVKTWDGQQGRATGSESDALGFVRIANVHHFATDNGAVNPKPHLWVGTELANFLTIPRAQFSASVEQRAKDQFTHLRVTLDAGVDLREAADRVREVNSRGLVAGLVLAAIPVDREARRTYLADLVPRFAALNITWMGAPAFEKLPKEVLDDAGALIARLDPYQHPQTSMAETTSAPLSGAKSWATFLSYGTASADVGAVEHQLNQLPAVNTGIRSVRDLWNATMNGQYPDSGDGAYITAWRKFMAGNRYWELEPYFDVDGGRALALEGVEYIVYIEKPGPVEVTVENHGYDVAWINPLTGERIKAKDYKGQHFTGEAPDRSHEWVLHLSREGAKEGMLKSYKFESRRVPVQEVENNADKVPFDVSMPPEGELSISKPPAFVLKTRRESRATRALLVEWTVEAPADGEGYRVAGTGREGTLRIPESIAHKLPAVLSMRVQILNANGKAYELDRAYRLVP